MGMGTAVPWQGFTPCSDFGNSQKPPGMKGWNKEMGEDKLRGVPQQIFGVKHLQNFQSSTQHHQCKLEKNKISI